MKILLKNGRVVDYASKTNEKIDILIEDGVIIKLQKEILAKADNVIDCTGLVIIPGMIDMHCHLREPGFEYKETIETGSKSAVISNTSSDTPLFFSSSLLISTGSSVSTIIFVTVRIFSSFLTILLASGEKIISYLSGIRRFFEYVFVQMFLLRIFLI